MLLLQHLRISIFFVSFGSFTCQSVIIEDFSDYVGILKNCSLEPESKRQKLTIDNLIDQENRLITIHITVNWSSSPPNDTYPEHLTWFLTTDDSGKHLLELDDHFIDMSLSTLAYGITETKLSLLQTPNDCLGNMSASEAETQLIFSVLTLPETPAAFDEDGINLLNLCTGSATSDGSCCKLTFSGEAAKCQRLIEDTWLFLFQFIILVMSLCALSQVIYFIPTSIFDDSEKHSFHILGNVLKLKVKVSKEYSNENCYREINAFEDSNCLKSIRDCIENKMTQQIASCNLKVQSVMKENLELVPEFYPSTNVIQTPLIVLKEILRNCFNNISSQNNSLCSKIVRIILKVIVVLLCTSPIILRSCYIAFYLKTWDFEFFCNISFIFSLSLWTILTPEQGEKIFNKSIKDVQNYTLSDVIKDINIIWSHGKTCNLCCKYFFTFPVFIFSILYVLLSRIFVLMFLILLRWVYMLIESHNIYNICGIAVPLCVNAGLISIEFSVIFFTECFAYILVGLFLNYELILDKILLIAMVITYIVNCFATTHSKIHHFNLKVTKLVDQINKEIIEESHNDIEINNILKSESNGTAIQVPLRNHNEKAIKVFTKSDGRPFLSVPGLFIFRYFEDSDKMPISCIPKRFIDKIASVKGRFTPGPKHTLFLRAVLESSVMCLALFALFLVLRGFMRVNNVSATIHTIVSVGSSAAVIMFNKLLFKAAEPTFDDHDIHLKELIRIHIREFEDYWEDIEFEVESFCKLYNNDNTLVKSVYDPRSFDSDYDLIAKVGIHKVESFFCNETKECHNLLDELTCCHMCSNIRPKKKDYKNIDIEETL